MRRRVTGDSTDGDAKSLKRRITQSFASQAEGEAAPELYQGRYGVYNDLTWDKLKAFLESQFPKSEYPGLEFKETREDDYWVFETPKPLTAEQKKELEQLRDAEHTRRRSVTPE